MVHHLCMGVHDPCTINYMEVYGDFWQENLKDGIFKMAVNELKSTYLVLGLIAMVTLMLDVGGAQDLQPRVVL